MQNDTSATTVTVPADVCQLPGCEKAVEQPAGGGPRKRFCSDQHRVQFWRQSRPERGESTRRPSTDTSPGSSPALALRSQLEQSVQSLEGALTKARTTLIELANLEEAEVIRLEAFSSADEQVARAQGERAAEERRRRAAENLAEAASSGAKVAEEEAARALARAELAEAELMEIRQKMTELESRTKDEVLTAREEAEEAHQARAAAEAQAHSAGAELERVRVAFRSSTERLTTLEQRFELESTRHREELATATDRTEKTHQKLEHALGELRIETEHRAKAEGHAHASDRRLEELRDRLDQVMIERDDLRRAAAMAEPSPPAALPVTKAPTPKGRRKT